MANNLLEFENSAFSANTIYAVIRSVTATWWNGATFEAYNATDWPNYAVTTTQVGTSGYFTGSTPALTAGIYDVGFRLKATGTAAPSDLTVGGFEGYWDGTNWYVDLNTPINMVQAGGSTVPSGAIPNAVAGAAGGLAIVGSNVTFAPGTDFSTTMKTSLNAATPASIQSVTNIVNGGAILTSSGLALVDVIQLNGVQVATSGSGSVTFVAGATVSTFAGGAVASVTGNVGGVSGVTFPATVASPTNITAGTITTATNLTNAPTAGDFTAPMKASLNAATPSITSVTTVTGNVNGSVGSVASTVNATLVATGLDAISIAQVTGPATTWPQMVVQIWRRWFKKATEPSIVAASGSQLLSYADDTTTVLMTQPVSDDGVTQVQGPAS